MHPPVLTSERIEAMFSGVAEVCFAAVETAGERLQVAPDMADFERAGRTLQTACRNLRQTIALKQRFDREQAALAADRRREADAEHKAATQARESAVTRHHMRVRRHFERVLWNEYEEDDAQEMFNDIDERLGEISEDAAFLETPVETLITRLAEEFGVGAEDEADADVAPSEPQDTEAPVEPRPSATVEAAPEAALPPEPEPPEPEPPPRSPDPPPAQPYIPPWEHPRAAFRPPGAGGTGW
jgi:hypothetical protein